MAEFNLLRYKIIISKDTKAVQDVSQELKKVEQQGKKVAQSADGIAKSFGGIGNVLKTVGIAAFLFSAVKQATASSDAINELNEAWKETIGLLVKELEPAIALVSRGLQGMLVLITGLVQTISTGLKGALEVITKLLARDFTGALAAAQKTVSVGFENILDTVQAAGDRAAQITRVSERVQSKIILEEGKIRLAQQGLTGQDRLKIVNDTEKRALQILRASGEFIAADKTRQAKAELEILKELSTEREAAQREIINNDVILATTQAEIRQVAIDDETTSAEIRQELLDEQLALRIEAIRQAGQTQSLETETINAKIELLELKHAKTVTGIKAKQGQDEAKLFEKEIANAASAAAKELQISGSAANAARAASASGLKDAANAASKAIIVEGAKATARAFARGGGFPTGIPFAVATAAFYSGLAATVSAVGGTVAGQIAPPSGGGAAAAPVAPEGPFGAPVPVEVTGGGGGGFTTAAVGGGGGGGGGGGLTINGNLIIETVSSTADVDRLIEKLNNAALFRGQRIVATELI